MPINGKRFDYEDITIRLLSQNIEASKVKYGHKQDINHHFVMQKEPVAWSKGKYEANAEITVPDYVVHELNRSVGRGKSLTDIAPFDITVSFAMEDDPETVTHILQSCSFTEVSFEYESGEEPEDITLPLMVGRIEYNPDS